MSLTKKVVTGDAVPTSRLLWTGAHMRIPAQVSIKAKIIFIQKQTASICFHFSITGDSRKPSVSQASTITQNGTASVLMKLFFGIIAGLKEERIRWRWTASMIKWPATKMNSIRLPRIFLQLRSLRWSDCNYFITQLSRPRRQQRRNQQLQLPQLPRRLQRRRQRAVKYRIFHEFMMANGRVQRPAAVLRATILQTLSLFVTKMEQIKLNVLGASGVGQIMVLVFAR